MLEYQLFRDSSNHFFIRGIEGIIKGETHIKNQVYLSTTFFCSYQVDLPVNFFCFFGHAQVVVTCRYIEH
jgi:hypothetical protein